MPLRILFIHLLLPGNVLSILHWVLYALNLDDAVVVWGLSCSHFGSRCPGYQAWLSRNWLSRNWLWGWLWALLHGFVEFPQNAVVLLAPGSKVNHIHWFFPIGCGVSWHLVPVVWFLTYSNNCGKVFYIDYLLLARYVD